MLRPRNRVRATWRLWLVPAALGMPWAPGAAAQIPSGRPAVTAGDIVSVVAAGALWALPEALHWNDGPPACAPCDQVDLPGFDRWALGEPHRAASLASDITLTAAALVGWAAAAGRGPDGRRAIATSVQATAWAIAVTQWAKVAVARKRPVLYTDLALQTASDRDTQRSMPSGHTAAAFALATSHWLSARRDPRSAPWLTWVLAGAAVGVGGLRVAASEHHPSDVLVGAGVGIAATLLVHEIRF